MSVRTLQDQVNSLLTRRVAESRTRGAPNTGIEAAAVFESIALNLLLKPRSALYVALLARNRMLQAVTEEQAAIETLTTTINDLANVSFLIRDTEPLSEARIALLQLEGLPRIDPSSGAYKRFSSSIQEFLDKSLSRSVRRSGKTDLVRPRDEAAVDLPTDLAALKDLHEDLLDRLYALRVGVGNFLTSPINTVLGLATATRARIDMEDVIESLEADQTSQNARDVAIRLIANRAAVRTIGSRPSPFDFVIDTASALPEGFALTGRSSDASVEKTSSTTPFAMPVAAQVQVSVGATVINRGFPQHTIDLQNKAHVVGNALVFPVTIPDQYYLFLSVFAGAVETPLKVAINTSGVPVAMTKAAILTALNTGLGVNGSAVEFADTGSNRILIYTSSSKIVINSGYQEVSGLNVMSYTNSAHVLLGFEVSQDGVSGSLPLKTAVAAWNFFFESLTIAVGNQTDFSISGVSTDPTSTIIISGTGASPLGMSGTHAAMVPTLTLKGTTPTSTGTVSPVGLVQVGDLLKTVSGEAPIEGISSAGITLASDIPGFDGSVSVTSSLTVAYNALANDLFTFVDSWLSSKFSKDLVKLDYAVAALAASPTPARRNVALAILSDLSGHLEDLVVVLEALDTNIAIGAAQEERQIVDGILATLRERKFDRAEDLLLRCKLSELSELTAESASFGGYFLQAMSDLARHDVVFPNISKDEGLTAKAVKSRIGRDIE